MHRLRVPHGAALAAATIIATTLLAPMRAHSTGIIGTNLGLSILSSEGSTQTVIGIPHSGDALFGGLRPGLRLGNIGSNGTSEFLLDTGVTFVSVESESFHSFVGTANYQHNFSPGPSTRPFVTAGLGIGQAGFGDGDGVTFVLVGGGVGFRHWFSHGHGATRAEVRYDRLNNTEIDEGANVISIKLGFDLVTSGE